MWCWTHFNRKSLPNEYISSLKTLSGPCWCSLSGPESTTFEQFFFFLGLISTDVSFWQAQSKKSKVVGASSWGWFKAYLDTIIGNLQVCITNVHIRYEVRETGNLTNRGARCRALSIRPRACGRKVFLIQILAKSRYSRTCPTRWAIWQWVPMCAIHAGGAGLVKKNNRAWSPPGSWASGVLDCASPWGNPPARMVLWYVDLGHLA